MFEIVSEHVFPFLRNMAEADTAHATHMKGARFTIPTPALLAKVVDLLADIPMEDRDTKGDLYEYMLSKIATRRPERPVPHAAPHHRADGRDDGADAKGRDLRSRLRHLRLPGRGRRISARQPSEAVSGEGKPRPFPRGDVPRLRFRRHHAADRLDEHDAARRRQSRHPLQGFAGAGTCRRRRPLFAGARQSAVRRLARLRDHGEGFARHRQDQEDRASVHGAVPEAA